MEQTEEACTLLHRAICYPGRERSATASGALDPGIYRNTIYHKRNSVEGPMQFGNLISETES